MKKIIILLALCIFCGCANKPTHQLYVFYSKTCPECQLMKEDFLEKLDEDIIITYYDMDQPENTEKYKQVLDQLENVDASLYDAPLTPFLYFEDSFGAIGYSEVMDDLYRQLIDEAINHIESTIHPSGVWFVKED